LLTWFFFLWQTELKTALDAKKKEQAENEKFIAHWEEQHETLELRDIDGDDEEEEEEENGEASGEQKEEQKETPQDGDESDAMEEDPPMKPDPDAPAKKKDPVQETGVLHTYRQDELKACDRKQLQGLVELLDEKVKRSNIDLTVLQEYRKREAEYLRRAEDLERISAERDAEKQIYEDLRKQRLDEFMAGFNMISLKLKELYQMITMGGNAELELVDSMDPFQEGITFSVMPPKKSWKAISNLSGGEKTLSSLALVFALHVFKPTPLYFMDEIDAALDFRNVSIVANYIKDRTKNAQFIIISLRNDMFELSQRLIGIYKTNNATQSITIDNHSLHSSIVDYPSTSANGAGSTGGPSVASPSVGSAAASVAPRAGLSTRVGA
jgi:structural maintenance of chromosome 4